MRGKIKVKKRHINNKIIKKARIEFQSEPFRFYIVGVKPQPTFSLSCEK